MRAQGAPEAPCPFPGCEQVKDEPSRRLRFIFVLNKAAPNGMGYLDPFPADKKRKNWECVSDMLRKTGAEIRPRDELNDVVVVGSYGQVKRAFSLVSVVSVQVDCDSGQLCRDCLTRASAECETDQFCRGLVLQRVDWTNECIEPGQMVACMPRDTICNFVVTFSRDSAGDCWKGGNTCLPANFRSDGACQARAQSYQSCSL